MGFPGYFLIVAGLHPLGQEQWRAGRAGAGLGAGSLVAYSLKITDLDPLEYALLFERFLNPSGSRCPTSTSTSAG